MTSPSREADALVIGGGFYGASIAVYLARRGLRRIVLVEREDRLLARASYNNQARVHNGYHYPRSLTTAYRSRVNLPRFIRQWPDAVRSDFTKVYAVAAMNSKVTARQFERFCQQIEAPLRPAAPALQRLFDRRLVEAVYEVDEYAFDATRLAARAAAELAAHAVEVRLGTRATEMRQEASAHGLVVRTVAAEGEAEIHCRYVFNCGYSGINQLGAAFPGTATELRQEITEMALVDVPPELKNLGITVMDGPFFSLMPFPPRGLHTLSHVRYTPHLQWLDRPGLDPYGRLPRAADTPRVDRMVRDVRRYLPVAAGIRHVDSLCEIKTILVRNDGDDGRPILFEKHPELPGCYSILGGKIDNIFDVLERLDAESFPVPPHTP